MITTLKNKLEDVFQKCSRQQNKPNRRARFQSARLAISHWFTPDLRTLIESFFIG